MEFPELEKQKEDQLDKRRTRNPLVLGICVILVAFIVIRLVLPGTAPTRSKAITVNITHSDGSVRTFNYHTGKETLRELLEHQQIATGDEDAGGKLLLIAVDAEASDYQNGRYWSFSVNGAESSLAPDDQKISDGDVIDIYLK